MRYFNRRFKLIYELKQDEETIRTTLIVDLNKLCYKA